MKNLFGRTKSFDDEIDIPEELLPQSLSEGMIRRDNFFHNCWMLLKKECPNLGEEMNRVELRISGYDPDEKKLNPEEIATQAEITKGVMTL